MNELGRYVLSCVLSFLIETEGTSFLITKKQYAYQLLPVFRLRHHTDTDNPQQQDGSNSNNTGAGGLAVLGNHTTTTTTTTTTTKKHVNRHKFLVVPAQDPLVLLARLNTRRLGQRLRKLRRQEQEQHQQNQNQNNPQRRDASVRDCRTLVLPVGCSTFDIAKMDCQEIKVDDDDNNNNQTSGHFKRIPKYTPCLLRFALAYFFETYIRVKLFFYFS
ncbi:hypothetical protein ACA910_009924 [Epithemia clementina (nom. ined.)]